MKLIRLSGSCIYSETARKTCCSHCVLCCYFCLKNVWKCCVPGNTRISGATRKTRFYSCNLTEEFNDRLLLLSGQQQWAHWIQKAASLSNNGHFKVWRWRDRKPTICTEFVDVAVARARARVCVCVLCFWKWLCNLFTYCRAEGKEIDHYLISFCIKQITYWLLYAHSYSARTQKLTCAQCSVAKN